MRKYYIDWIRNLGILFLIVFHTARFFNDDATSASFYVKGQENAFSTVLVYATSFWFTPLLFLISGMSAFYVLRRRSTRQFARDRTMRLLVPFVFGCLVIVPPQSYYALRFHEGYAGNYLEFLWSYFTDFAGWDPLTGLSPAHLWFIVFLFVMTVATLPLMRWAIAREYSPTWMRDQRLLFAAFAGLLVLSFLPAPGGKSLFVSAGYFVLGFFIATDDAIIDGVERTRKAYLLIALVGTAAIVIEELTVGRQAGLVATMWHYPVYWAVLLAILGFGKRYLDRPSKVIAYLTQASFPIYIVHQTYLVVIAYYVLQVSDHGVVPFVAIALTTLGLSIATYELNRRYNPVRALFGLRSARSAGERIPAG
jgi:surface polysaccharide O-acyltransferase-like enzyme